MRAFVIPCFVLLVGCPPAEKKAPASSAEPCARVGQSCEFSPGKLGTCVQREGCAEANPSCFTCQSQH